MQKFIRLPQLQENLQLSKSGIYLKIKKGEFPTPVSLGARAVGWLESDIDAWISKQLSARPSKCTTTMEAGAR